MERAEDATHASPLPEFISGQADHELFVYAPILTQPPQTKASISRAAEAANDYGVPQQADYHGYLHGPSITYLPELGGRRLPPAKQP